MCQWSLDLIFEAKLMLESGNWKIQYGCQAAILKVTSLKINRLLAIATNNMHMKFEIEIPRQTRVTFRKPCRLQMDRQTDRRTDKVNPVYTTPHPHPTHPPTSLGGGIIKMPSYQYRKSHCVDKTILRPSYLHNGISFTGKTTFLYRIWPLVLVFLDEEIHKIHTDGLVQGCSNSSAMELLHISSLIFALIHWNQRCSEKLLSPYTG